MNNTTIWVLVDGEMITATAPSRKEARGLKKLGYAGTVRKALITLA